MDVREVFDYEPDTGRLRRRHLGPRQKAYANAIGAGGYRQRLFGGKVWLEHRLIFLWHHGWLPPQLDHIDGDTLNNRIENLRPATSAQNNYNRGRPRHNKLGVKGVNRSRNRYRATIRVGGKKKHLGYFPTAEEAHAAYIAAAEKYAGEFARAA